MDHKQYLVNLNWRYATKKYDPDKKLSEEQMGELLEATRLAPSSFGLTPYKIYRVKDGETRKQLQGVAFGQTPFVDAAELLVFGVPTQLNTAWVDRYIEEVMKVRGGTPESVAGYKQRISDYVSGKNASELKDWSARQAYIALGFLLSAAAEFEIDATPIEGFDPAGVNEILGMAAEEMTAVVCCALGYRSADDPAQYNKKVRFAISDLVRER